MSTVVKPRLERRRIQFWPVADGQGQAGQSTILTFADLQSEEAEITIVTPMANGADSGQDS